MNTPNIPLSIVLLIVATHFLADFPLQTNWMAMNKSKNWRALLTHAGVYSICWSYFGIYFILITFMTHAATDAITSRITSSLWDKKSYRLFFTTIGFDQLIHYTTLFLTYSYLYGY